MTSAMRCRPKPYIDELCDGLALLALLGPNRVRNSGLMCTFFKTEQRYTRQIYRNNRNGGQKILNYFGNIYM